MEAGRQENLSQETTKIRNEKFNTWVERGFDEHAVASFGTSSEVLNKTLKQGSITSAPIELPYQRKLTNGGQYLYYATPILERITPYASELAKKLYDKHLMKEDDWMFKFAGKDPDRPYRMLSAENAKRSARIYSMRTVIMDSFLDATGISLDEKQILDLGYDIVPDEFEYARRDTQYHDFSEAVNRRDRRENEDELTQIKTEIDPETLKNALENSLQRRGVIIYFNEDIFKERVIPGYESDEEILIIAEKPLPVSVISGIEILSSADREAIVVG